MVITNEILKSAYSQISNGYAGIDVGIDVLCRAIGCTVAELNAYISAQDGFGIMIAPNSNGTRVIGADIINISNKADDLSELQDEINSIIDYDNSYELVDLTVDSYDVDGTVKYIIVTDVDDGEISLPLAIGSGLNVNIKNSTDSDIVIAAKLVEEEQDLIDAASTLTLGTGEKVLLIDVDTLTWVSF